MLIEVKVPVMAEEAQPQSHVMYDRTHHALRSYIVRSRCSNSMCTLVRMRTDADGRSMRERMLAGDLYLADDPDLAEAMLRAADLMDAFNTTLSLIHI